MSTVRIGTRGSRLARWQADLIAERIRAARPDVDVEMVIIHTTGDRDRETALSQIGGVGLFTKELERALLDGRCDLAVHSLKDLPSTLADGLCLAGTPERADPRDAFVSKKWTAVREIPAGGQIATGSNRRRALLREMHSGVRFVELRGNIGTRLEKLEREGHDGIVMAVAAMERLGLDEHITERLDAASFIPAAGQGAIGIEARDGDETFADIGAAISCNETLTCVRAERAFQRTLEAGCTAAVGVWCTLQPSGVLRAVGFAGQSDGDRCVRDSLEGDAADPERLGSDLAERMIALGAGELIA